MASLGPRQAANPLEGGKQGGKAGGKSPEGGRQGGKAGGKSGQEILTAKGKQNRRDYQVRFWKPPETEAQASKQQSGALRIDLTMM